MAARADGIAVTKAYGIPVAKANVIPGNEKWDLTKTRFKSGANSASP